MYREGTDDDAGVVITIYCAGSHADDEYERSIQNMHRVDGLAARRGAALVHFVIEDQGSESPSAKWRKRFAEVGETTRARSYHFALVTSSTLIRGGFTAMQWMRGERPGHHLAAFSTFEQACAWVRQTTGASYPRLEALYAETRARGG